MTIFFPDGVGGSTGDSLASASPLLGSGIIYVDSVTGSDSYDGLLRTRPKASLSGAYSASGAGYIIVLLSTHTETINSVVTVSAKNVTIIGEGSSDGEPTVSIAGGNNVRITFSGDDCQIRNVKFVTSTTSNSNAYVAVTGKRFSAMGCRFEVGSNDSTGMELSSGSSYPFIGDCEFVSTTTDITDLPDYGLLVSNGADGLEMNGTVFSDGSYGFNNFAFSYVVTPLPNIRAENVSLLLGAKMNPGSSYNGFIHIGTSTGGGRVV